MIMGVCKGLVNDIFSFIFFSFFFLFLKCELGRFFFLFFFVFFFGVDWACGENCDGSGWSDVCEVLGWDSWICEDAFDENVV